MEELARHIAETSKLDYDKIIEFFEGVEEQYEPELLKKQIGFSDKEFDTLIRKLKKFAKVVDKNV